MVQGLAEALAEAALDRVKFLGRSRISKTSQERISLERDLPCCALS